MRRLQPGERVEIRAEATVVESDDAHGLCYVVELNRLDYPTVERTAMMIGVSFDPRRVTLDPDEILPLAGPLSLTPWHQIAGDALAAGRVEEALDMIAENCPQPLRDDIGNRFILHVHRK